MSLACVVLMVLTLRQTHEEDDGEDEVERIPWLILITMRRTTQEWLLIFEQLGAV